MAEGPLPRLTDKQRLFVEAYLGEARLCAVRAARRAGYAQPEKTACKVKASPAVRAHIEAAMGALAASKAAVLTALSELALDRTADPDGKPRVRHADRIAALGLLARHHGLLTERHEVEIRDVGIADALDRKLAGLAAALAAAAGAGRPDRNGEARAAVPVGVLGPGEPAPSGE